LKTGFSSRHTRSARAFLRQPVLLEGLGDEPPTVDLHDLHAARAPAALRELRLAALGLEAPAVLVLADEQRGALVGEVDDLRVLDLGLADPHDASLGVVPGDGALLLDTARREGVRVGVGRHLARVLDGLLLGQERGVGGEDLGLGGLLRG